MTEEISTDAFHAWREMQRNKYGNRKVPLDGYTFDSQAEAARYSELKFLLDQRAIRDLTIHPRFKLLDGFVDPYTKKKERPRYYEADFRYYDMADDRWIVEDVKGTQTAVFRLKWAWARGLYQTGSMEFRIIQV